jgi:ribosomal protein S18 acetylase RimI-like enzyme
MNEPRLTVVVRERKAADLPAAAAALVEVHRTDGYPVEGVADPIGWLTTTGQIRAWVAELDAQVVGHVAISEPQPDDAAAQLWASQRHGSDDPIAVLGRLFVSPTARGHAVGRRLVEAVQTSARVEGLQLVLDVMAKDSAAIALYERLGWRRIGTTNHDDGRGNTIPAYCFASPT